MEVKEHLGAVSSRRFGIEIELNSFDGKSKPNDGDKVSGIDYVASVVDNNSEEGAEVHAWEHTNNNKEWIIKPDSSCGMEICTPPLSGWKGIQKVCKVVEALAKEPKIQSDKRCSVHVHVDFADLSEEIIGRILGWYIKCEPIIMDAMPPYRKVNRYCQFVGMTTLFSHDDQYTPKDIINRMGDVKYYSLNAKSLKKESARRTVEFRMIEGDGCRDPYLIKNWVRFILHFVSMASNRPLDMNYRKGDPWSHLCWLDPEDFMRFIGFSDNPQIYDLSRGLTQTRDWLLARMNVFMDKSGARSVARGELDNILRRFKDSGVNINPEDHLTPKEISEALYGETYRY